MKYMNKICVDAGTVNCPCPLAETGDCLLCSRLAGEDKCDCDWCGLCIYNEFVQNDKTAVNIRAERKDVILRKIWYTPELLVLVLKVDKGFALSASIPGSFVFVNGVGSEFFSVPVSVMFSDVQKGQLFLALRVISAKTKAIAGAEDFVLLRGVYRNGLLGGELSRSKSAEVPSEGRVRALQEKEIPSAGRSENFGKEKWLIFTKGIGLSPAINLISGFHGEKAIDMVIDTEKITEGFVHEALSLCTSDNDKVNIMFASLADITAAEYDVGNYDKIAILASDYYIVKLAEKLNIPQHKLVFSNNFRMCCGEGICGACGHVDADGNVSKMCKCRQADVRSLFFLSDCMNRCV